MEKKRKIYVHVEDIELIINALHRHRTNYAVGSEIRKKVSRLLTRFDLLTRTTNM